MTIFSESLKGFMWGLGFALATLLVYTCYGMYIQAGAEFAYKKRMNWLYEEHFSEQVSLVKTEVIGFKKLVNGINIASKTNSLPGTFSSSFRIKFTLMNAEEFLGTCYQDLDSEKTDSKFSYYQTLCSDMYSDFNKVTNINISVIRK